MVDYEKYKPIVIADKETKHYFWVIGLEVQRHDIIVLHFMDKYNGTAESLARLYRALGLEKQKEVPDRVKTVNEKNGKVIDVNEIVLEKIGALKE